MDADPIHRKEVGILNFQLSKSIDFSQMPGQLPSTKIVTIEVYAASSLFRVFDLKRYHHIIHLGKHP